MCLRTPERRGLIVKRQLPTRRRPVDQLTNQPTNQPTVCHAQVVVHRDDCSKELLEWGSRVAAANSRPPQSR